MNLVPINPTWRRTTALVLISAIAAGCGFQLRRVAPLHGVEEVRLAGEFLPHAHAVLSRSLAGLGVAVSPQAAISIRLDHSELRNLPVLFNEYGEAVELTLSLNWDLTLTIDGATQELNLSSTRQLAVDPNRLFATEKERDALTLEMLEELSHHVVLSVHEMNQQRSTQTPNG